MQIYLVGGAVRNSILGIPVKDRDFVITGATEKEMTSLGYKRVGKSFPVFLHPDTKEEYALARKEIKKGPKHGDFQFIFTPDISLEEDVMRRDFTCNALYQDLITGEIIDFCNGRQDIKNKVLRHVSDHFAEDPLRVLRMCRFASQLDFSVAPETMELCQKMVNEGQLKNLSPERIWQELEKALSSKSFYRFIQTAKQCGALSEILPEVDELYQVPERTDYHPEGNSGDHTLLTIKAANSTDAMVNFAAMLHDIGKIRTDKSCWPSHHGHEKLGIDIIKTIGKRLRIPKPYVDFATFVSQYHMIYHQKISSQQFEMADIAIKLSHKRNKKYCHRFLAVLKADMCGRDRKVPDNEQKEFNQFESYMQILENAAAHKKISQLKNFDNLIQKVKDGIIPPSVLNDTYIKEILRENPLHKTVV